MTFFAPVTERDEVLRERRCGGAGASSNKYAQGISAGSVKTALSFCLVCLFFPLFFARAESCPYSLFGGGVAADFWVQRYLLVCFILLVVQVPPARNYFSGVSAALFFAPVHLFFFLVILLRKGGMQQHATNYFGHWRGSLFSLHYSELTKPETALICPPELPSSEKHRLGSQARSLAHQNGDPRSKRSF